MSCSSSPIDSSYSESETFSQIVRLDEALLRFNYKEHSSNQNIVRVSGSKKRKRSQSDHLFTLTSPKRFRDSDSTSESSDISDLEFFMYSKVDSLLRSYITDKKETPLNKVYLKEKFIKKFIILVSNGSTKADKYTESIKKVLDCNLINNFFKIKALSFASTPATELQIQELLDEAKFSQGNKYDQEAIQSAEINYQTQRNWEEKVKKLFRDNSFQISSDSEITPTLEYIFAPYKQVLAKNPNLEQLESDELFNSLRIKCQKTTDLLFLNKFKELQSNALDKFVSQIVQEEQLELDQMAYEHFVKVNSLAEKALENEAAAEQNFLDFMEVSIPNSFNVSDAPDEEKIQDGEFEEETSQIRAEAYLQEDEALVEAYLHELDCSDDIIEPDETSYYND